MGPAVFVGLVALVAGVAWWSRRRHAGRERQLMLLCERAGLRFAVLDPFQDLWLPFGLLGRGSERGVENAVWQASDDTATHCFDFWYRTQRRRGGAWPDTIRFSCAAVAFAASCPRLTIEPREAFDAVEELLDLDDVELELEDFNRRFRVRAANRRFAVTFLDQRMMRAMLGLSGDVSVVVAENRMLLVAPLLPAADVLLLLEAARSIGTHVPRVVASLFPPRLEECPHEDRWLAGHWTPAPIGDDLPPPPPG